MKWEGQEFRGGLDQKLLWLAFLPSYYCTCMAKYVGPKSIE